MKTTALGFSVLCSVGAVFAASQPAHAGQVAASCAVVDVATFNNRVHIHCTAPAKACQLKPGGCGDQGPGAPPYVAVESSSPMASTVVQVGLFALSSKHLVDVFYDDNPSANPAGCNQDDCRRLLGVVAH